ncbi:unknown [Firmicutes bacterium CAG:102]|nr:unknown [Firmicutes bacterium CAG:102]
MWKNTWLKELAGKYGLEKGKSIIVEERSLLKDYTYITREIRHGVVLELYPHHFYCQMENGRRESFRYNEFLGHEARLVHLKEEQQKSVQAWTLFFIAEGIGKQGRIASLCPKWNPEFALVKIMYLHPALFQSCLPDT